MAYVNDVLTLFSTALLNWRFHTRLTRSNIGIFTLPTRSISLRSTPLVYVCSPFGAPPDQLNSHSKQSTVSSCWPSCFLGSFKPGVPQKYLFLFSWFVWVSQIIDTNKRHILNLKFKTTHLKGTVGYTPLWHFIFWSHFLAFFCTVCTVVLRFPVAYEIFAFEVSGKVLVCVYPFCPGFQDQVFHSFFEGRFIIFTNLVGVFNVSTSQHYNVPGGDIFDEARNWKGFVATFCAPLHSCRSK